MIMVMSQEHNGATAQYDTVSVLQSYIFQSFSVANVNHSIMFSPPLWLSSRQSLAPEIVSPVYDSWFELSETPDEKDK